jgi:transcription elongation factor Elf1
MKKIDDLREIIKNTKHRRPTQIFCPRCGSPKMNLTTTLAIGFTPKQYYCENCGYVGTVVMELEIEKEETGAKS